MYIKKRYRKKHRNEYIERKKENTMVIKITGKTIYPPFEGVLYGKDSNTWYCIEELRKSKTHDLKCLLENLKVSFPEYTFKVETDNDIIQKVRNKFAIPSSNNKKSTITSNTLVYGRLEEEKNRRMATGYSFNEDEIEEIDRQVILREEYFRGSPFKTFCEAHKPPQRPVKVIIGFLSWSLNYGITEVPISSYEIGKYCNMEPNVIRAILSNYCRKGVIEKIRVGNSYGKASFYKLVKNEE